MSEGFQLFDIIIFALIAGFLVLRLRNVLGRRTGRERMPPPEGLGKRTPEASAEETVVRLPPRESARRQGNGQDANAASGLTQLKIADPSFAIEAFIAGARSAFEMIVDAFAKGDHDTLRALLSDEVYANFSRAISAREGRGETLELTLVGIRDASVQDATMDGTRALITVKIVSEQIRLLRNAKDEIVDGTPGKIAATTDIWTFARDTRSRNPNWSLVATEAAA